MQVESRPKLPQVEIWIGFGQLPSFKMALARAGLRFESLATPAHFRSLPGIPILEKPYFQSGKGALMEYDFAEPIRCDFRFLLSWTNGTLEVLDIPARKGQQHNP